MELVDSSNRELLDPDVISHLRGLTLSARGPMQGTVSGRHRSPHRGSSVEFSQYRKYVQGDDPRRLDWRAYGRSDRYYLKEFEADTNLRLLCVLDTSGSMRYGSPGQSKADYGKRLVATLMHVACQQGDAVGLVLAGQQLDRSMSPRRSPAHFRDACRLLSDVDADGENRLIDSLHQVAEQAPARSLIAIVSDLFVSTDDLAHCLQHLRHRKHDVAIFHLLHDAELEFEFNRPTRFVDLEGGGSLLIEPSRIRNEYATALREYLQAISTAIRESSVDYHRVSIDQPYAEVLVNFLLGRMPRRKRR